MFSISSLNMGKLSSILFYVSDTLSVNYLFLVSSNAAIADIFCLKIKRKKRNKKTSINR